LLKSQLNKRRTLKCCR